MNTQYKIESKGEEKLLRRCIMEWYYNLIIFGIIVVTTTIISINFFSEIIIEAIFIASSITTFILGVLYFKNKDKDVLLKLFEEYQKETEKHRVDVETKIGEFQEIKKNLEKEQSKNIQLSKMVDNIGITLNKENIPKDELIKNISKPLKAIVFMKYFEKQKNFFNHHVYPKIHAYSIRAGLHIIPPRYVLQNKSTEEILECFFKEIEKYVPKNYKYNIPFASVVSISNIKSFKRLDLIQTRGHFDWLTNVPTEDIAPTNLILEYLASKNISTRDIIELPNLMFLVDENNITFGDKTIIENKGNKIINDIKKHFKIDKLKTTDFANIGEKELSIILLDNSVKNPLSVSKMLIDNAKVWKVILDRQLH